jgi:uncharacterized protein
MTLVLYALGVAALAVGIAGVVLPAIPGSALLVVGALLVAWAEDFTRVGWGTVIASVVIAILIWIVDWAAALLGARAFGASRWSVVGAGIGLLVGLFLGLPGILLGPIVGAVAFEYARNPDMKRAAKAGAGAFVGFVLGSAVKVALAFVTVGAVALAVIF